MTVLARGHVDGVDYAIHYELYDEAGNGLSSMSRTTGFTCSAVARLVSQGDLDTGVIPLEYMGRDRDIHDRIIGDLIEWGGDHRKKDITDG